MAGGFGGQGGVTHQGGLSVYGSGFSVGTKLNESFQGIPGADGLQRFDGGLFGVSGWALTSFSTRLSSILFATAQPFMPATGLAGVASGYTYAVGVQWSGNSIDFTMYANSSGTTYFGDTSSGTSSKIGWLAIGY